MANNYGFFYVYYYINIIIIFVFKFFIGNLEMTNNTANPIVVLFLKLVGFFEVNSVYRSKSI